MEKLIVLSILYLSGVVAWDGVVWFYEGNDVTKDWLCDISWWDSLGAVSDFNTYFCPNDEARSMKIVKAKCGTVIKLFNEPSGWTGDDWTEYILLKDHLNVDIGTFESSYSNDDIIAAYTRVEDVLWYYAQNIIQEVAVFA